MEKLLENYSNEEIFKALKIITELKLERERGNLPEFIRGRISEVSEEDFDLIQAYNYYMRELRRGSILLSEEETKKCGFDSRLAIDVELKDLIIFLNTQPNIKTLYSCSGHQFVRGQITFKGLLKFPQVEDFKVEYAAEKEETKISFDIPERSYEYLNKLRKLYNYFYLINYNNLKTLTRDEVSSIKIKESCNA
ncbi:hypothetical protein [Clostridium sp. LIBA-8841]|uniref:hypothetical protein n=1 Tax=Clostridium sp. LIBA-8841 TaxID=2987530 RepID=UPI002AC5FDA8|nr:hypothetical protein [Clostridium sp. LIBA-8841]MDZ5255306.1 hypothetical protein [Clostridium sp. LIBA-8841]